MDKRELIKFWVDSSDDNYQSMLNMFKAKEYMWSMFLGHLTVEKLLKAYFVKAVGNEVPRTHDLYKIAVSSGIALSEQNKNLLQYITLFNIRTRYEDYKKDFQKKCTKAFAANNIQKIKELRIWLKGKIKN